MLVIRSGIHQLLVRVANRVDPDQKQSDLGLHCLSDKTVQTWIRLMEHTNSDLTEQSDLGLLCLFSAHDFMNQRPANQYFCWKQGKNDRNLRTFAI